MQVMLIQSVDNMMGNDDPGWNTVRYIMSAFNDMMTLYVDMFENIQGYQVIFCQNDCIQLQAMLTNLF